MEVILLERVAKLGQMGDTVRVRDGFARNFLLPRGKALRATEANKERFESAARPARGAQPRARKEAEAVGAKLDGQSFVIIRQAGETGVLYGSVSTRDLADDAHQRRLHVGRDQIVLNAPIKTLGLHKVPVALHPEVEVTVTINVARQPEEAERQARGETVTDARGDQPRRPRPRGRRRLADAGDDAASGLRVFRSSWALNQALLESRSSGAPSFVG